MYHMVSYRDTGPRFLGSTSISKRVPLCSAYLDGIDPGRFTYFDSRVLVVRYSRTFHGFDWLSVAIMILLTDGLLQHSVSRFDSWLAWRALEH